MFTETPRLLLRDLTRNDFDALHAISSDPEVFRMNDFVPADKAHLREWLQDPPPADDDTPPSGAMWAIVLKSTNEMIGWIGFGPPGDPRLGDLDFGYALNRAYWNQGYMTEAVRGMLAYCFDVIKAQKIAASHRDDNPASGRVMQKVGMRPFDEMTREMANGDVYYIITHNMWRDADPKGLE
jgi:ribosomal-protein-alanine N-acetyltransferase